MLSRRGKMVAASSILLIIAGRVIGAEELYIAGTGTAALVAIAAVYVRAVSFRLQAARELRPVRVHAGSPSRVELAVRNVAARRSPVLTARDPFDGGRRAARFLLAPLAPGEMARAAYALPTDRRGVFALGPLELELSDPFGLAVRSHAAAPGTQLTVYPRVDVIPPPPLAMGHDPHAGADHASALTTLGEDFFALRPYETGDDLRRVHWASSAHTGDLMIRQEEMPWQGRATVVLDLRYPVHTDASLEAAVSAAASVVTASWQRRALVRLVTTSGYDSGFAAGHDHVEAILEELAGATTTSAATMTAVLASLRRHGGGGAAVVITTGRASTSDFDAMARLRGRYGSVTLVAFERSSYDRTAPLTDTGLTLPRVSRLVRVDRSTTFSQAWSDAMAPRPSGAGARS